MDTNKWLAKATLKEKGLIASQPALGTVHGNLASDGKRLHIDNAVDAAPDEFTPRCLELLADARKLTNRAAVSKIALEASAKAAKALRDRCLKGSIVPDLKISLNGKFEAEATSADTGTIHATFGDGDLWQGAKRTITVRYTHEGKDADALLNPNFLLDAISGFDDGLVRVAVGDYRVYLAQGSKEAIVMQKYAGS